LRVLLVLHVVQHTRGLQGGPAMIFWYKKTHLYLILATRTFLHTLESQVKI
jgi:hypothetical protein